MEKRILNDEARKAFGGSYVQLSEGTTRFILEGPKNAPLIVMINGFSVPLYIWDNNIAALHRSGFQTLRYDLYGRGGSDRPQRTYNRALYLRQLQELLMHIHPSTVPIHLVAICMGSIIATDFSLNNTHPVASLTFIGPAGLPGAVPPGTDWLKTPLWGDLWMTLYGENRLMTSVDEHLFHLEHFPEYKTRYYDQMHYIGFKRALLSTIRNMPLDSMNDEYLRLSDTPFPKLMIWGEEDVITPATQSEWFVNAFPDVHAWVIPDAGHVCNYEQAESVNTLLVDFINKTEC